ncbi:MAG: hypothetical protein IIC61_11415, partial [Proteobacteria bacterium]|nr:hypothetical protein [Pseudomonadota bacterium]
MRKLKTPAILIMTILGLVAADALFAHHSAVAFDKSKTQVVTGTVKKFVWRNPH